MIDNHIQGNIINITSSRGERAYANAGLFCARDHFGIKTLYYCLLPDGRLLCATDISEIAADAGYRKAIDPDALQLYMMFGYPAGEATLFRGIRKLMPGCALTWDAGVCRIEQYYRPAFHPEYGVSEQDWIDRIDGTLQDILDEDRAAAGFARGARSSPAAWIPRCCWPPPG
ncbi:MAG: hypothetical protein IKE76_12425 [Clostridia bacterium]|nr:hypothetical protein [Clostridia bacterium]